MDVPVLIGSSDGDGLLGDAIHVRTLADQRMGGIEIQIIDGRYCPVVVCDACGQRIKDPTAANVEFHMRDRQGDLAPYFAHKGRCDRAIEAWLEQFGVVGWEELCVWLTNLLHNTGMSDAKIREGRERADMLSRIG